VQRHPAADQTGVPALRHDGRARLGAGGQDGRDLLGIGGPDDRGRVSAETPGPVHTVASRRVAGQDMLLTDNAAQGLA